MKKTALLFGQSRDIYQSAKHYCRNYCEVNLILENTYYPKLVYQQIEVANPDFIMVRTSECRWEKELYNQLKEDHPKFTIVLLNSREDIIKEEMKCDYFIELPMTFKDFNNIFDIVDFKERRQDVINLYNLFQNNMPEKNDLNFQKNKI